MSREAGGAIAPEDVLGHVVALVDRSVRRVLALKESLGLFDRPYSRADMCPICHGPSISSPRHQ